MEGLTGQLSKPGEEEQEVGGGKGGGGEGGGRGSGRRMSWGEGGREGDGEEDENPVQYKRENPAEVGKEKVQEEN